MTVYEKIKSDKAYLIKILCMDGAHTYADDYLTLAWEHYCHNVCKPKTCEIKDCDQDIPIDHVISYWLDSEVKGDNDEKSKN